MITRTLTAMASLAAVSGLALAQPGSEQARTASVNDAEIEYVISGPESGEAILFIHGAAVADSFALVMAEPALEDFRLIRMHRRGYMGSSEIEGKEFSMAEQAADAAALLDALDIEAAHIVGHSYGGAVAVQMAVDSPERVRSLVLAEGGINAPPPDTADASGEEAASSAPAVPDPEAMNALVEDALAMIARFEDAYEAENPEDAFDIFFGELLGEDFNWRESFDSIPGGREQALSDARTVLVVEPRALIEWAALTPVDYGSIEQPVLYIWGEGDGQLEPATVDEMMEVFAQGSQQMISDSNHSMISQQPGEVAEVIAQFIRQR